MKAFAGGEMSQKCKNRIFEILETSAAAGLYGRVFTVFIMALISLNVIAVMLETVGTLSSEYESAFHNFEIFSVVVFTIEYVLRLWTCTIDNRFRHPVLGRLRFAVTAFALVDLLAIVPFYLPMLISFDLRFVRVLRLFRLFRLFKIGRYSESLRIVGNVLKSKKEEIAIAVFVALILLILASSLMYFVEHDDQPEAFPSIPATMWWGVTTLTTVGYGDVHPVTAEGKLIGTIVAVLGIGLFALPAGILASGFAEEMQKRRGIRRICPHCGKDTDELGEASTSSDYV